MAYGHEPPRSVWPGAETFSAGDKAWRRHWDFNMRKMKYTIVEIVKVNQRNGRIWVRQPPAPDPLFFDDVTSARYLTPLSAGATQGGATDDEN